MEKVIIEIVTFILVIVIGNFGYFLFSNKKATNAPIETKVLFKEEHGIIFSIIVICKGVVQ